MTGSSGSWQPDPYGRHQLRWWDGARWTSMVSDNGVQRDESAPAPMPVAPPAPTPMPVGPVVPYVPATAGAPKRSNRVLMICIVVAVALVAVGVIVRLTKNDDGGSTGAKGESQTPAGKEYVDAIVAGGLADNTAGFTTDEVRCMAENVVDDVGVDALQGAGITPDSVLAAGDIDVSAFVTQAQAEQMADDIAACIDFRRMVTDEAVGSDVPFTDEQMACIGDEIGASALIREMFVQSFMGSEMQPSQQSADALGTAVVGCIDFGQLIADSLAASGVQLDAPTTACIGEGMNGSELIRQMFAEQFLTGGSDTPEDVTPTSARSAANELLGNIVGSLFGASDAATTDALTQEMTTIFTGCGVDLGG